jgi:uncharacterized protein
MSDYIVALIKPLLAHPESLSIRETRDAMGVLFTVCVSKEDMGKIIGKEGETSRAIKHLVRVEGYAHGARISVKIVEPVAALNPSTSLDAFISNLE